MTEEKKNYYEVLEISIDATAREISQGYQRVKNAYSGDCLAIYSLMTKDECDLMVEQIEEAYNILGDHQKRVEYDRAHEFNKNGYRSDMGVIQHDPIKTEEEKKRDTLSKIVAQNRFALNFEVDPKMEQEIEQATEFTGEFLRKIREYKNVDIPRLSDMIKVSKTYLNNIENEEYENLPAMVYTRGFVYQYAKCLKLNPDLVCKSYVTRLKAKKEGKLN